MPIISREISFSAIHNRSIDMTKFNQLLAKNYTQNKVMAICSSLLYTNNDVPIWPIMSGCNISHTHEFFCLLIYIGFSILPSHRIHKCGVKESGCVTLGQRSEKNHSALDMAMVQIIPDTMTAGTKIADTCNEKMTSTRIVEN